MKGISLHRLTRRVGSLLGESPAQLTHQSSGPAQVRAWNLRGAQPTPEAVLNGHTDWVTAVSVLDAGAVVTGSCDSTIRLWRARAQGNVEALAILQVKSSAVSSPSCS